MEREREESSCREEESKGLPFQIPTTNVSNDSNLTLTKCVFMDSIDMSVQGFFWKAVLPVF